MLSLRKKITSVILELYTNIERGYGSLAVIKELLFYVFKILFLVIYYNFSIYIFFTNCNFSYSSCCACICVCVKYLPCIYVCYQCVVINTWVCASLCVTIT